MWYDYTTYTRSMGSKYPILKLCTSELACFNVVVQTELFTGYMEIALSTSKVLIICLGLNQGLLQSGAFLFRGVLSASLDPVSLG